MLHHVFDETEGKEEILLLNTWAFTYVRHVDFFLCIANSHMSRTLEFGSALCCIRSLTFHTFCSQKICTSNLLLIKCRLRVWTAYLLLKYGSKYNFMWSLWEQILYKYHCDVITRHLLIGKTINLNKLQYENKNIKSLYQLWLE